MESYTVCQLQKDMRFEGFLLVRSAEKRKDVKGNDYVDMNLTDRTGKSTAKSGTGKAVRKCRKTAAL